MKLFVAKLDYAVTSEELQTVFEEYGAIKSCNVVMDRETGRSRGFGFVEMESQEDAQNAISELDGSSLRGRELVVKKADDNGGGGGGNRRSKSW